MEKTNFTISKEELKQLIEDAPYTNTERKERYPLVKWVELYAMITKK